MKLKFLPEDFRVEELPKVSLDATGDYAFYRLRKRSLTTHQAIESIARRWKVPPHRIDFGGLKDRHAVTVQYVTLLNGPHRNFSQQGIEIEYLGQVLYQYRSDDFEANRFEIILRDMTEIEIDRAIAALAEVEQFGVANYFDDQRFGSVEPGGKFIGREMIAGRYESALRLATVGAYEHDRAEAKRQKAILTEYWGVWERCRQLLRKSPTRAVWNHLAERPDDFLGALERLNPEMLSLYLAAYQSHVWNRVLASWIRNNSETVSTLELKLGVFPSPRGMTDERRTIWETLSIPLPSARLHFGEDDPLRPLMENILAEDSLTLREMKIADLRKPFFSKGDRVARLTPTKLTHLAEDDDRHLGRHRLTLCFELPRAAYATMVVKTVATRLGETKSAVL